MKRGRVTRVIGLLTCLLFFAALMPARAQEQPPHPEGLSEAPPRGERGASSPALSGRQVSDYGKPGPKATTGKSIASPSSGAPLGSPGFSLRAIGSYGHSGVAYLEDTDHFLYPFAVAATPDNVWIADSIGERALQFKPDGTFVSQVGVAGYRYGVADTSIEDVVAVAQDGSGNLWLADDNASHVVEVDGSGAVVNDLGTMWESGTGNDQFSGPRGIAFDSSGNVYIADNGNSRIQIFSSSGSYLATIGESGVSGIDNAHFYCPNHIAIDSSDLLYVPDTCNARVQIFDVSTPTSATYVATMGVPGVSGSDNAHFSSPIGVAVDDSVIYVADFRNQRVQVFDHGTRAYQATIGTGVAGTGNDQFNLPSDVAIDSSGNVYIADQLNFRVQEFDSSGNYVRTFGTTGVPYLTDGTHFNRPNSVAKAGDGSMYVVEGTGQRLLKLNSSGGFLWSVGEAGVEGSDNDHFIYPNDVDLDGSGNVYVTDTWNHRIQIFSSAGSYSDTLGGTEGSGDYELEGPMGLAIAPDGRIYVADTYNQRVQIYNSSLVYQGTLGETGVSGSDNAHFSSPWNVAVDGSGDVYVVDHDNERIQVFNSSGSYVRTIGETGVAGDDFGHLSDPISIAVDSAGHTYVGDQWGGRIQVFDNTGAYLTTVGWFDGAQGLVLASSGDLYAADQVDLTIRVYTPGVPGWTQSNLNGFGNPNNVAVLAIEPFGNQLFAGTYNPNGTGAQVWEQDAGNWSAVVTNGFGHAYNVGIDDLQAFGDDLYASTWADETHGGEVYRTSDGSAWSPVVTGGFGDSTNAEVFKMIVFNNQLYASTWSYTSSHGSELWRSPSGNTSSWARVVANGFGDSSAEGIGGLSDFQGYLYAGTYGDAGKVWRSSSGDNGSWTQVSGGSNGPGSKGDGVSSIEAYGGFLYVSSIGGQTVGGAEVWRCQLCDGSDWERVISNGMGDGDTHGDNGLIAYDGTLYWFAWNSTTGIQVWSSSSGDSGSWEKNVPDGLGDVYNISPYWDQSLAVFGGRLFAGLWNEANGGELWMKYAIEYLPLVVR